MTEALQHQKITVLDKGLIDFDQCLKLQTELNQELQQAGQSHSLILCSHPSVFTAGTATKPEDLLNITPIKLARGGSVTYHGPEQLIAYPILNLNFFKRDVSWYMRSLEEVMIKTASQSGINTKRIFGRTGIWIDNSGDVAEKLGFIGVKFSRWCSFHGLSINLTDCNQHFEKIKPCGFSDIKVTSFEEILGRKPEVDYVKANFLTAFQSVFEVEIIENERSC